jgi:hypothetical protein
MLYISVFFVVKMSDAIVNEANSDSGDNDMPNSTNIDARGTSHD